MSSIFATALGHFGSVVPQEDLDRGKGVVTVFGVSDLRERFAGCGLG